MQSRNLVREYALKFYQDHQAELEGLRFEQFNASFRITDTQLQALSALAARTGLVADAAGLRRAAPLLRTQLKAHIARIAYGKNAYYTVLAAQDIEFQQALRAIDTSTAQLTGN
ncbi:hypothetical protein [Hymenobacter qilianensis]|uniref:hypothetical protein n=1 Tax=Hymenobacter qilianensis TaxID=1385715 RepID=UPI001CB95E4F|nr:hypothetical protein [Hymenobacter qilianensis]